VSSPDALRGLASVGRAPEWSAIARRIAASVTAASLAAAGLATAPGPAAAASTPRPAARYAAGPHREPYRDPTAAAVRSLVLPGWGQHYNGEGGKGNLFTCGVLAGALFAARVVQVGSSTHGQEFERGAGLSVMIATWGWSIVDAYTSAPHINRENGYELDALAPGPDRGVWVVVLRVRW
jgi:hypothetical protein